MPDADPDALTRRLDRLERESGWWRLATFAMLLLLVTVGAAPKGTTLDAERLVIRSPNGKVRAILGIEMPRRGWPQFPASETKAEKPYQPPPEFGLFIYGDGGVEVARLTDWAGAGALLALADTDQRAHTYLRNWNGIADIEVKTNKRGLAKQIEDLIALSKRAESERWDEARQTKEFGGLSQDKSFNLNAGSFGFNLHGKSEQGSVFFGAGPLGGPTLSLWDFNRKSGVDVLLTELSFRDEQGARRGMFKLADDGVPSLTLLDQAGRARAVLGRTVLETVRTGEAIERPESSLVLFDKDGKVLWKAP